MKYKTAFIVSIVIMIFADYTNYYSFDFDLMTTGDGEMEMITFRKSGGIYSTNVYHLPQPRNEPDVKL